MLHIGEFNQFVNLDMDTLDLSNCSNLGNTSDKVDLEDGTRDYINIFPRAGQTLIHDFTRIDMNGTHLAGINLKPGNTLESVTYGDYARDVVVVNQSALTELCIPENAAATMEKLVIEGCDSLEEITWIAAENPGS